MKKITEVSSPIILAFAVTVLPFLIAVSGCKEGTVVKKPLFGCTQGKTATAWHNGVKYTATCKKDRWVLK